MKRLSLFTLLLFLCIATLEAAPRQITVWHSYRGAEETAINGLAEEFNALHRDDIRVTLLAVPYDAFANKITSAVPRGNGPDAFIYAHERIGDWAASGIIEPLGPYYTEHIGTRMLPVTIEAMRSGDKLWGIPLAFKSLVLFYRTDLMDAPPGTTDELLAVAERFTDRAANRYGIAFEAASAYFAAPFLTGFGGGFCLDEAASDTPCLDTPENAAALSFIADIVRERKVAPDEATGALVTHLFAEGRVPMVISGPWLMGELPADLPYAVATLPVVSATGLPMRPLLTVEAYIIAKHRRTDIAAARAFGEFLSSEASARQRALAGRQSVATLFAYDSPAVRNDATLMLFKRQAEQALPMSNRPAMRMVWEPLATALRKVLRGADTPQHALAEAGRHYALFTRPPAKAQSPAIFLATLLALAVVGFGYLWWRFRRERVIATMRREPTPYLYLLPAALSMFILVFIPFTVGTAVSFFAHRAGEWRFVGLANFVSILSSQDFPVTDPLNFYFTLAVTVGWTAVNVALHVGIGLALAMLLRDQWLKLRGVYRILLIVPWAVPNYITALIWKGMFNRQFGAVNGLLDLFGVEPVSWFSSFWTAFAANVATNTWLGFPFMMVTALGALQAVPRELEDAAAVDGAGAWDRFRHVILPLLRPALLPAVILGSVWTFNMFNIIFLVSGGDPDGATDILISEAYKWAFQRQEQYGYAAAYATLIFIVLLLYSKFTERRAGGTA